MRHSTFHLRLFALVLLVSMSAASTAVVASRVSAQSEVQGPFVGEPLYPAVVNIDLRDLPQEGPSTNNAPHPALQIPLQIPSEMYGPAVDPVAETQPALPNMPSPLQSFAGLDFSTWGAGWPPDTNGDVGPTYYIQTVNSSIGIFTKSTGALAAAFTFNDFFSGTSTPCDANNNGDPVVLYDPLANRWIITDFAWTNTLNGPYYECIAVSQTGDPVTGGWYMYGLRADDVSHPWLNDYPKLGVWPDGYYMSANMFDCLDSSCSSATFQGTRVWALNRSSILNGGPLTEVHFDLPSFANLLPSNLRGMQPPTGSPNFFAAFGSNNLLRLWKFHIDWASPANSTFTGPTNLTVAAFTLPSSGVPQQGSSELLDTLHDRLMMQLQYRNINGTESLWANHTVASGGVTGVRWYEVRNPNGTPTIHQQGTYQPNSTYRWMGSLAVDRNGNMAIGYSASSSSMFPAIRYAGRLSGDTLGTLAQGEATLIAGTGSQNGGFGRWGDYSAMSVDPVDDCTFWYTTEYYITTGSNWQTRIGSFKFPSCSGTMNIAPTVSAGPDQIITLPNNASLDGTVSDDGLPNPPATVTTTWSKVSGPGTVTFGNANAVDTTASFSAAGPYVLQLTANDSALSSSDQVSITVNSTSTDPIFADSFASCNLSAWSGAVTGGGDLSATPGATLVGTCGMQAVVNDNTALYVSDITPANETRYRARFYFNPNSIAMASGDIHYLLQGLTGAGTNVFTLQLNNNTGTTAGYRIRTQVFNDATSATNGTYFNISNATHFIEIDWQAATAAGANNGYITLWIDGVQKYTSPGIDNDTRRMEEVRLGAVAGIDTGTRGTYYFDAFESRRLTYIGPAGTGPNAAPVVSAGPDQIITLPNNASLDGTVSDDGLPNPPATVTTTWSKVSGPGTVTFGNANAVDTTASFSAAGPYVLQLTANDSALSSSDQVSITVNSTSIPDLIIQSITPVPANPQLNQAVDFSVMIKNQGQGDAAGFWVDLFIDTPLPTDCSGAGQAFQFVSGLAAGASQTLTINYAGFGTAGSHTVNATVDTNCNVSESNESNNTHSINVSVGGDPNTIFNDSFESDDCTLSPWSSCVHDNFDLNFNFPSLVATGNQSMNVLIDDNNAIYVTSEHPNAETRYVASFYFDPNSISMVNGDTHTIFGGYSGTSTLVLRLQFRRSSNLYQVQAALLNDGSSFTASNWFTITDAPHQIALDWQAATTAGANNGALTLSIDGTQQANLTGVDNDTRRIDLARLGAVAGIDAGTRGTYYFDEFKSSRGDTPPPSVSVVGAFTADGNWNPKTAFVPGDPIQWVLEVQNDTGQDAQIELTFDVRDPNGAQITFWNGIVTTGPGLQWWGLSGTVQSGSDGTHTLFGSGLYQGTLSEASSTYSVGSDDLIFKDSFESDDCTLSPWSSCVHDNFDLKFDPPPLTATGNTSMNILIDDNNALYVTSDHPNAAPRYRARFYFDPNSIPMVSGNAHFIFYGYNGTSKAVVRVEFRNSSSNYQLRAALLTDSSSWNNSSWFTITDAPHPVEIDWRASTGAGANNGGLTLWIDGIQKANLTGVDNDTWRIDRTRLGAVSGIDTGTRGTYYFDVFESRRQSYIGPLTSPAPSSPELGPVSVPPIETPTSDNTIVETNN